MLKAKDKKPLLFKSVRIIDPFKYMFLKLYVVEPKSIVLSAGGWIAVLFELPITTKLLPWPVISWPINISLVEEKVVDYILTLVKIKEEQVDRAKLLGNEHEHDHEEQKTKPKTKKKVAKSTKRTADKKPSKSKTKK